MLQRVVERTGRASSVDRVIVATTVQPSDDAIVDMWSGTDIAVVRGSETDVLGRYHDALLRWGADVIIRITSDCPLIDPNLIDAVVEALSDGVDYASNTLAPRTFPRGLDVEAMTADTLERAWAEDRDPAGREHVTPYVYEHPERFALRRVANASDQSEHRWTVDTPEDLELVRRIYDAVEGPFGWRDVLELVEANPSLSALNRHVEQKRVR